MRALEKTTGLKAEGKQRGSVFTPPADHPVVGTARDGKAQRGKTRGKIT